MIETKYIDKKKFLKRSVLQFRKVDYTGFGELRWFRLYG